ncbi:MAG: coproporphyrinogen III oxidase, partial [Mariprofundaceae bacterium]
PLPDESAALAFLETTYERLQAVGYARYEVSNHARTGFLCRHNDAIWRYQDYIGIGAGAAGKHDTPDGGCRRWRNLNAPEGYMRAVAAGGRAIQEDETLSPEAAAAEACWLGLRRTAGVERAAFRRRFGADPWTMFGARLARWCDSRHLAVDASHLRLTESGMPLADAIAAALF